MPFLKILLFYFLTGMVLLCPCSLYAAEPIPIVVTLPVLKSLVEKVGGRYVTVSSLITGLESEHTYTPRPSDVIAVKNAKMLVKVGLGLDIWLDSLIKNADRPNLLTVTTSKGVPLIKGNPHIWLDPEMAKIMTRHITKGLSKIDPARQKEYQNNEATFALALDKLTAEMIVKVKGVQNPKIITHHPAWPYFAKRFGFIIAGEIQPQVGSEPSAKRMVELTQLIRRAEIGVVLSEPQLNPKMPVILAEETGAQIVILSPMPVAHTHTEDYLDFIRYNVETLVYTLVSVKK
jgi:ABC-type Zn uptake system ZnuABC Zn-binding protein ZnuA